MPIINHKVPRGTMIRYVGPTREDSEVPDTTPGSVYRVADVDGHGVYYIDDAKERNYSASPDGDGDFEIVETY